MNTNSDSPLLSVVTIPVVGHPLVEALLAALRSQQNAPRFEIIVPHDSRLEITSNLTQNFPEVRFIAHDGLRSFAELRASAIHRATGSIVAITEDHCLPDPNWCAAIISAHKASHAVVGGVVEKRRPDSTLSWAIYFADYLRYAPPQLEGPRSTLTDLNVTYKRVYLDSIAEVWAEEFHENLVHEALLAQGEVLWLSPDIRVSQGRRMTLMEAMRDRYSFGRLFASTRTTALSAARRLILLITSVAIPALLVFRVIGHIRRARQYSPEFFRALPLVGLLSLVWASGEFMGYLTGRPAASMPADRPLLPRIL